MDKLLATIRSPDDLKQLDHKQLAQLAACLQQLDFIKPAFARLLQINIEHFARIVGANAVKHFGQRQNFASPCRRAGAVVVAGIAGLGLRVLRIVLGLLRLCRHWRTAKQPSQQAGSKTR